MPSLPYDAFATVNFYVASQRESMEASFPQGARKANLYKIKMKESLRIKEEQREMAPTKRRREAEIERQLEQLSRWTDNIFRIPVLGWRFGLDPLLGLIPGVGDSATALVSVYILTAAVRYRVPKITLLRMGLNIGLDYVLGSIPFVGDLFDAWWKTNQKNVDLLRQRATVSAEDARQGRLSDWLFVSLIILVLFALLIGSVTFAYYLLSLIYGALS